MYGSLLVNGGGTLRPGLGDREDFLQAFPLRAISSMKAYTVTFSMVGRREGGSMFLVKKIDIATVES